MGQILLEMLWGLEYSIFFIILMISMCFLHLSITMISRFWLFPRSWSWDPGHCLRIFCYYPSWRVPLYIVDGCTYFNVYMLHIYICIYIHTYYICWIEVYNLSRSDLGWYPSWWTSSPWILVMPSFLDAVPPGEETSLFSVSVHAVHDANHWGMMKPDPSFRFI